MLGLLVCALAFAPAAFAINASPNPVDLRQPDGTRIRLYPKGDEFSNWFEDENHFAVVRSGAQYSYAALDGTGQLTATALLVGRVDPAAAGLIKGLAPSPEAQRNQRIKALPPALRAEASIGASELQAPPSGVAPVGTVKNLVILCKFSDHVFGTHTRPQADYNVLFNTVGGSAALAPTGSVRDYYAQASYGIVTLQSTVVVWVTLPHTEAWYAAGSNGTGGTYPNNAQGMVKDALDLVDPLVNFSQFDTDGNGFVDAIDIIHSGYGAEWGTGGGNLIWSHKWSLWQVPGGLWTSQDSNANGVKVKVSDYHTEPALWSTSGTAITRIGVICHETGHFLGLPDLYDTDNTSQGIGSYCLMANSWGFDGSQLYPPHFSAWCKLKLGWVTPTVITSGTFSVPQAETNKVVFKITAGYGSNEYLLIENRQPWGFEADMPQGGLAIWHIDESKLDNKSEGYPLQSGWPSNNSHYKVALLQADGQFNMERNVNRGDAGDLYRGGGISSITASTVPNTDRYEGGIVGASNNSITNISASGAGMTFTLSSVVSKPNLIPYQPVGWSDKIVVSTDLNTTTDSTLIPANTPLYVDWAAINNGLASVAAQFYTQIYVDGILKTSWYSNPPLNQNYYVSISDYAIGGLSPGTHTIRIKTDSGGVIAESNEADNEYTKTITVVLTQPNLTPYRPANWSDKIVVSTTLNTNTDAAVIPANTTLYIDWAAINNGTVSIAAQFYTQIYVDGVLKTSWYSNPPLNQNYYVSISDYAIGGLSVGTHTIRIKTDSGGVIAESNEGDNEYTKTIKVVRR